MTSIREAIRRRFSPVKPLKPGIYHFQAPPEHEFPYRYHLRIEGDGNGILIVNASTVLHLNQTAAEYAYHLVNETPPDQMISEIAARYRISKSQIAGDYEDFQERIFTLVNMPDLDPVSFLDFERDTPYSGDISAPYRLDCALTYRLPPEVDPNIAPTKRVDRELTTDEWKIILKKAWGEGIPHIIFTGGEPTLRDDLPDLIAYAEALGQVTGLLTNGLKLTNNEYLQSLLQTGLDHLMIVLQPENEKSWQAVEKVIPEDIFTTVHLTISPENKDQISEILTRLEGIGVTSISLSDMGPNLDETLESARDQLAELGIELEWDLPVPYSSRNPVTLETDDDSRPDGAGRAWLYVEPDGDVLPAQGINEILGNFFRDEWEVIWK